MALRRSARVSAESVGANGAITRPLSSTSKESPPPSRSRQSTKSNGVKKKSKPLPSKPNAQSVVPELPSTPKRRRHNIPISTPPPITPTPSAVGLMTGLPTAISKGAFAAPEKDRLAGPHQTNAHLLSPETSRIVAYSDEGTDSLSSKQPVPRPERPTTTTGNILEEACAHLLKVDPKLKPVIEKYHCAIFSPEGLAADIDPFEALTSGILAQQVSGAAAKAIKKRFVALFNNTTTESENQLASIFPTPSQVAASDLATLRSAGLSGRKAEYIKGLAEKFHSGELSAAMLMKSSDAEVMEKLVAVRGLGIWSVQMFACFALKRLDVFATGDLGVQRGMAAHMGRDVNKLKGKGGGKWKYMSEKDMLEHSAKYAPYRSLFMWYMWRIENVDVDAMQGANDSVRE